MHLARVTNVLNDRLLGGVESPPSEEPVSVASCRTVARAAWSYPGEAARIHPRHESHMEDDDDKQDGRN